MSRGLTGGQQPFTRDYGATSSSDNAIQSIPDVNFSGFSPTEFMSLSDQIGKNISSIQECCNELERLKRFLASGRDKPAAHEQAEKSQAVTNIKIEETKKYLTGLTSVVRRGDKSHQLQLSKLTADFTSVVQKYSKIQQAIALKMKQRLAQASAEQQDAENGQNMSESDRQLLLQQQRELGRTLEFEHKLMLERENHIKQIESNLLDINKTMIDINDIVNKQAEQINTIEIEIDNTAADVEAGTSELRKAETYRRSYRKKICILLVIAIIIGAIVTSIIVSKLKS